MKKGYYIFGIVLLVICVIQGFAIIKLLAKQKEPSNQDVSSFINRVQKNQPITHDDFDGFFKDDFFKGTEDPFKEMESIHKKMRSMMLNNVMNSFDDSWESWFKGRFGGPQIAVKTEDTKDAVVMHISVPGLQKNNLDVNIDKNRVKIECDVKEVKEDKDAKGNRLSHYSSEQRMTRILSIPPGVDESKAVTKMEKDEITITFPKKRT